MGRNYMPEVAWMLGVEIGEPFDVFDEDGEIKGCGPYRFTDETIVNCDDEGAPIWLLHYLLCGKNTLQKRPWRPMDKEIYWLIKSDGDVHCSYFYKDNTDDLALLNMGNCFPSEEVAKTAVPEMLEKFEEIKKGVRRWIPLNT